MILSLMRVQPILILKERPQRLCDMSFVISLRAAWERARGSQYSAPQIDQFFYAVTLLISRYRRAFNRGHGRQLCRISITVMQ